MRAGTLVIVLWCAGCQVDRTSPGGVSQQPSLSFQVRPTSAVEGVTITPAVQVWLRDTAFNLIANASDTVTIRLGGGFPTPTSAVLSGTIKVAAVNGVATFADLRIDTRGERYGLYAFATGYSPNSTAPFNVTCACWSRAAPLPTARQGLAIGVVNGLLFAIGGEERVTYSTFNQLATVEQFDPTVNSWTTRAPMTTARSYAAAGVIDGLLYTVGGRIAAYGSALATLEVYDPATNTWTTKAPMPTARYGLAVAVVNGILYALGGNDSTNTYVTTVEAYDPNTNRWTAKAPLPVPRFTIGAGVVNGIIYAAVPDRVTAFDPLANAWTLGPEMPLSRFHFAVGVAKGSLYAVGGAWGPAPAYVDDPWLFATVSAYNPVANQWATEGPMPTARASLGIGVVNGVLYAVGGAIDGWPTPIVEAYNPAADR